MMTMNAATGTAITDRIASIQQSVADILFTPIGSRVMRRSYGSHLPSLLDQPLNGALVLMLYAAATMAITAWEERISLSDISLEIDADNPGTAMLTIGGVDAEAGSRVVLSVPITQGARS